MAASRCSGLGTSTLGWRDARECGRGRRQARVVQHGVAIGGDCGEKVPARAVAGGAASWSSGKLRQRTHTVILAADLPHGRSALKIVLRYPQAGGDK